MSDEIKFFTEVDLNKQTKDGTVASSYPAWYYSKLKEDLDEAIQMDEYALENDALPRDRRQATRERLKRNKERMELIRQGIPQLTQAELNRLTKVRDELGGEIRNMMFSRSDMKKGLADAHEEAKRMVRPSIKLSPDAMVFAKACNVRITDGKISRTGAEKIWKIASKYIDPSSPTNTEYLRKD